MNNKKYIKEFVDIRFFDMPQSKFKSSYISKKFNILNNKIEAVKPFIYICNKTTSYDRFFVDNCLTSNHVFLKESITKKLRQNQLSAKEQKDLLNATAELRGALISIVIFPEKELSAFGDFEPLSLGVTNYLKSSKYDLRFLELVGTYFAFPVWAKSQRKCHTKVLPQTIIKADKLNQISFEDANFVINNYLPSSASVYAKKFPLSLYSQKKAEGLEQIVYCCPKCKSLFSSYSEFNCLKCKNCGSAIEISEDGDILLSNDVHSLDDLKELQFDVISHFDFMDECLISYENINYLRVINESPVKFIDNAKLEIFPNYVQIKKNNFNKTLSFDEIQDIYLELNNLIIIELKDGETVGFQGKSKENLYVLLDLFKIAK